MVELPTGKDLLFLVFIIGCFFLGIWLGGL